MTGINSTIDNLILGNPIGLFETLPTGSVDLLFAGLASWLQLQNELFSPNRYPVNGMERSRNHFDCLEEFYPLSWGRMFRLGQSPTVISLRGISVNPSAGLRGYSAYNLQRSGARVISERPLRETKAIDGLPQRE